MNITVTTTSQTLYDILENSGLLNEAENARNERRVSDMMIFNNGEVPIYINTAGDAVVGECGVIGKNKSLYLRFSKFEDIRLISEEENNSVAIVMSAKSISINSSIDVNVQDQTTPPIDFFFTKIKETPTTVAVVTVINKHDIEVADATGCIVGDYFGVFNTESDRVYFGEILNISGDVLTMDTPFDFAFQISDTAACLSRDLNINGAVTPQVFSIIVGSGSSLSIDVNRIMLNFLTDDAVSLNTFGDRIKLIRGLILRRTDGDIRNIWNVKDNGELSNLCFDYDPHSATNPVQGQNGASFRYTFNGQDKHGVAIRIKPGESLDLIIQDNLESIQQFRVIAEGHYVDKY